MLISAKSASTLGGVARVAGSRYSLTHKVSHPTGSFLGGVLICLFALNSRIQVDYCQKRCPICFSLSVGILHNPNTFATS